MKKLMSRSGLQSLLRRVWAPAILLTLSSVFLVADGTSEGALGSERSRIASAQSISFGATLAAAQPLDRAIDVSPLRDGPERPFPILSLAGALLIVMTLALHFAAWRFAR